MSLEIIQSLKSGEFRLKRSPMSENFMVISKENWLVAFVSYYELVINRLEHLVVSE